MKKRMMMALFMGLFGVVLPFSVAAANEKLPLADGELFVSQKIVDGGKVLYKGTTATDNWNHDPEVTPDGFVGTAFVPRQVVLEKIDVAGVGDVKRMYTAKEKIQAPSKNIMARLMTRFLSFIRPWIRKDGVAKWPFKRPNFLAVCSM